MASHVLRIVEWNLNSDIFPVIFKHVFIWQKHINRREATVIFEACFISKEIEAAASMTQAVNSSGVDV